MLLLVHGENLMSFIVGMYIIAILVWTAFCYLIIKYWMKRKKQKQEKNARRD
jgi:predicted membrane protein